MRMAMLAVIVVAGLVRPAVADFALHDGDTVVFLGDSITAARTYGKIVENYTLLRFPERKVQFFNAGIGGDTAAASLSRLDRDVFAHAPTVVTLCFGMNDVGWGLKADREHVEAYLGALRTLVGECRKRHARLIYLTPPVTGVDPATSEQGFLQNLADDGAKAVRAAGGEVIDVQRGMRAIQKRVWSAYPPGAHAAGAGMAAPDAAGRISLHAADGTHLSDLGHLAMAFVILQGLGAPQEVSDATVDGAHGRIVSSAGCKVSDAKVVDGRLEFSRLDEGLPINFGLFGALQFAWVPFHAAMNRYGLKVTGLAPGAYDLLADGRRIGTFDAADLARGLDIASRTADAWAPGGPWDAQASVLSQLTDARHDLAKAWLLDTLWLPAGPVLAARRAEVAAADAALVDLQRAVARPRPYRFVVRKAAAPSAPR